MSQSRPELRIGDRERDQVAAVLQQALAEGRITLDELDVRLDAVLRARTFADLDPLVVDLPVEPPSVALTRPPARVQRRLPAGPGHSPGDRLLLNAGWSNVTRRGRWEVPPFLRVDAGMATVNLNCLQAVPLGPVIDVEVAASMGTVRIVLPDTWAANADRLGSSWGVARIKVGSVPAPAAPLVLLHGSVGWGWLTVRYANRFDRRRLEKQGVAGPRRPELGR